MVNKHCFYGTCESDSRYMDKPNMKDVFFHQLSQAQKAAGEMFTLDSLMWKTSGAA